MRRRNGNVDGFSMKPPFQSYYQNLQSLLAVSKINSSVVERRLSDRKVTDAPESIPEFAILLSLFPLEKHFTLIFCWVQSVYLLR